jgi:hypothetical protein
MRAIITRCGEEQADSKADRRTAIREREEKIAEELQKATPDIRVIRKWRERH